MTREQIIKNLEYLIQFLPGKSIYAEKTLTCAIAALRGPVPDPKTGLVPCGCGGRAVVWEGRMHSDTYYVQCLFCGVRTVDRVKKADAIREFNTAMGYKVDA